MNSVLRQGATHPSPFSHSPQGAIASSGIRHVLRALREHFRMDVAYLAPPLEDGRILEYLDAEGVMLLEAGQQLPFRPGVCFQIVPGQSPAPLPGATGSIAGSPHTAAPSPELPAATGGPLDANSPDSLGHLCFFSETAESAFDERGAHTLRAFAEVLGAHIETVSQTERAASAKRASVLRAMGSECLRLVVQPIYNLRTKALTGLECLSRFAGETALSTPQWFHLAETVGLREELELASIRQALTALRHLPPKAFLGVNSSPELVLNGTLAKLLDGLDVSRLVLEVTEHVLIEDYAAFNAALRPLRARNMRLAIDDAGAGYASMRHIICLRPDIIKLDMSLVRGIDQDKGRRAFTRALSTFAREIGSMLIAEGIETWAEFDALLRLGVRAGQGFLLHEPEPLNLASLPSWPGYPGHVAACGRAVS